MKLKNDDLLNRFDTIANWMIRDTEDALFIGKAQILVAQGLMNYIETIGSFILPDGSLAERFDCFFSRLGNKYDQLLKRFNNRRKDRPHIIYDDLRCGLTHEYAVKRKRFTILKYYSGDHGDNNLKILHFYIKDGSEKVHKITENDGGIIHRWDHKKGVWYIVVPILWRDFRNALQNYQKEIRNPKNKDLRRNFFKRAREINLIEIRT